MVYTFSDDDVAGLGEPLNEVLGIRKAQGRHGESDFSAY